MKPNTYKDNQIYSGNLYSCSLSVGQIPKRQGKGVPSTTITEFAREIGTYRSKVALIVETAKLKPIFTRRRVNYYSRAELVSLFK